MTVVVTFYDDREVASGGVSVYVSRQEPARPFRSKELGEAATVDYSEGQVAGLEVIGRAASVALYALVRSLVTAGHDDEERAAIRTVLMEIFPAWDDVKEMSDARNR